MSLPLPPLRALHVFEVFGRLGSVSATARELGVTTGAVSQQLKILEDHLDQAVTRKEGRNAAVTPELAKYHQMISEGFDRIRQAQQIITQQHTDVDLNLSGLPTLLLKWLNPKIHRFQAQTGEVAIRLDATHTEPDPPLLDHMFRLTYGRCAERFPHRRALFTDVCFPVCSPQFLTRNPQARMPEKMNTLPWIDIDWGPAYANTPRLSDWLDSQGSGPLRQKPNSVHSLSSLALEAAVAGQGIVLAQASFVLLDLRFGRLVRLSSRSITMPEPYYICWGQKALDRCYAREFLNWILTEARAESTPDSLDNL